MREFSFDQTRSLTDQWIRKVIRLDSDEHFLIICCTSAQAKAFAEARCVEIDLAYKMVAGKTNVFTIVGWDEVAKRKLKTCKAFA
jgi:hypothetical protein